MNATVKLFSFSGLWENVFAQSKLLTHNCNFSRMYTHVHPDGVDQTTRWSVNHEKDVTT